MLLDGGGVAIWVVNDATIDGSESGTSFEQALYFKQVGFKLYDTMIFAKSNPPPKNHPRYEQAFEYMFVFSKGKPETFNPILESCKMAGKKNEKGTFRNNNSDDLSIKHNPGKVKDLKIKSNIWEYAVGNNKQNKCKHPAVFPQQLAEDHILSWTNPGDLVFDPFVGSGTTLVAAKKLGRNYLGIEKNEEYYNFCLERLK